MTKARAGRRDEDAERGHQPPHPKNRVRLHFPAHLLGKNQPSFQVEKQGTSHTRIRASAASTTSRFEPCYWATDLNSPVSSSRWTCSSISCSEVSGSSRRSCQARSRRSLRISST